MSVQLTLTDNELGVSPVFVDFLVSIIEGKEFSGNSWYDQLSEELSNDHVELMQRAQENAERIMASEEGQRHVTRSYQLLMALLTGNVAEIRDIQFKYHFINIIGVPRNGGSYLTMEAYRSLGYDVDKVPNVIAHDGFPEAGPFRFHQKLLKGSYAGGFFQQILGESVEHILTVRHPVTSAISTYEKSGGLPEDGKFKVRGNIEAWVQRDLAYTTGLDKEAILDMPYFDAYLQYWEQYHYYVATTGLSSNPNIRLVPYGKERMEAVSRSFQNRFESGLEPSEFKVFENQDRHPDWVKQAEPVVRRVAEVWKRVGLDLPLDDVMEIW
ncbi:MAG: hypothetical protein P8Z75_16355 [Gammaproteobacteria bacterium]